MIRIRMLAMLACAAFAATAQAQSGGTAPAAFVEEAQKALIQQYCDKDPRFMQCLGVDAKKEGARCAELMRSNWGFCRSTFMMTAPAAIPASDARGYTDNLADCLRNGAIAAAGKPAGAVASCMSGAR